MGFTALTTDNFARGDSDTLGANWTETYGDIDIVSNHAKTLARTGFYWAGVNSTGMTSMDHYAGGSIDSSSYDAGFVVRYSGTNDYYAVRFRSSNQDLLFLKKVTGYTDASVLLDSTDTITASSTSYWLFSVEGTAGTVTIKGYKNGTLQYSYDDTAANRIVAGSYTGIFGYGLDNTYDYFEAGIMGEAYVPRQNVGVGMTGLL